MCSICFSVSLSLSLCSRSLLLVPNSLFSVHFFANMYTGRSGWLVEPQMINCNDHNTSKSYIFIPIYLYNNTRVRARKQTHTTVVVSNGDFK